jgi:serine/threonine protein kinase
VRLPFFSNYFCYSIHIVLISLFKISAEMVDQSKWTDSFVGTLAYMSPTRVRGLPYSYEADIWGLGMTIIACITGKSLFETKRGPWHLMDAILQNPQPTLDSSKASAEFCDFIHQCLNQPPRNCESAKNLLGHNFISSAKDRGIIPRSDALVLSNRGTPLVFHQTAGMIMIFDCTIKDY